jgi:hypothetical protein
MTQDCVLAAQEENTATQQAHLLAQIVQQENFRARVMDQPIALCAQ